MEKWLSVNRRLPICTMPLRTRNFREIYRDLQRFELYRRINVSKRFYLSFDSVTPDMLREFETFLRQEHTFFTRNEETGKFI